MTHQFAFVLDQQVGLRTQSLNIEQVVLRDHSIHPTFVPVHYDVANGPAFVRFPGLPRSVRGTLAGLREIREGLGEGRYDGVLWGTWAAKSVPDLVSAAPAYLIMDMTPTQMEAMGEQYGYSRSRASFLGNWKRQATGWLYREAKHLFAWSEWVAQSLKSDYQIPAEKVTAVPPGVDLSLFHPDQSEKPQGGDLLLRWARETGVQTPWELHLVTRDAQNNVPKGVFVHHGITNNSPELIRLYRRSDLFVLPTRADCFSLVSIEAMASGLPVISSQLGGIPEIVVNEQTGILTPPDDYDLLASQLDRLVEKADLRSAMSRAARTRAESHFDAQRNITTILSRMRQEAVA